MGTIVNDFLKHYDLSTQESFLAAIKYLGKKKEARDKLRPLVLIPWAVAMLGSWWLAYLFYYNF
jgi:hypothetical protein